MTAEIRGRDPLLFWTGAVILLALLVVTLISISDNRLVQGVNPWIKPMKFMASITIFLWTVAWFVPDTTHAPRRLALVRWTVVTAMSIEIVLITMQAARGVPSHFNDATAFDLAVFNLMGIAIFINTLVMAVFLWIVRRDTPPHRAGYLWGVRLGLAVFILASLEGAFMVANGSHAVPGPDGGPGLPLVNWSTTMGDLRVAHFFGLHGLQALPILGFLIDRAGVLPARAAIAIVTAVWLLIAGGLMGMALQGRPLLAL